MNPKGKPKKPFREWLLELAGFKIWPPTHNDPRIKGPQPRILTRRQWEAMETTRRERENDGVDAVVCNDSAKEEGKRQR